MGELKDTYTLPDGKKVDFAKGTAEEDVLKVLNTDHAESMAFTSQPKSKPENPGFFTRAGQAYESGFDNSTDKLAPGLDIVRAKLTGNQELYEQTQEDLHELGRAGEVTNPDAPTLDSVKGAFAEEGVGAAVSEGVDFVANSIGSTLGGTTLTWGPVIGTAVIAGAALSAGVIAAPTAALAGLITGAGTGTLMFTQFLADNLARGHDAGILDVNDVRLMESLGAAAVQTGSEKLGMRMFGIGGNIAGNAVKQAAIRTKAGLVKQAWQKSLGAGAAAAGKSLATETGTELGQQVMERAAAGLPVSPSDEAAMHEYTEVIAATLAGSLPFSGYAGGNTYTQNARDVSANKKVEETNEFNAEAKRKSIAREQANKGRKELEEQTQTRLIQEELMAESKDEERLAILEEDERAKLEVEGIVGQERTLTDVKLVAASRGIDIDSTPSAKAGFIRVVRGVTGSANIKDATPQEMELIYQKLSTIDTGGANSALPLTSTSEAFEIAEKLEKDQKKNKLAGQTAVQVKRKVMALIKKEETIYDPDHVSLRADAIIKRMLDRTLMLRNTEETSYTKKGVPRKNTARKEFFNIALGAMQDLAGDEKRRVATTAVGMAASNVRVTQDSKGNGIEVVGEYPSREELRDAVGDIPDDVYKEVRDSLHARGILKKEKGKFLYADVPDVLTTRREFAVSTDQVSKWIVRDKAGKVVAVENTQLAASNAKKARPDAKVLSKPVREKGYAVRETEFSDVEGGEPRRLRSMNVDFVANLDPTSRGQAEDRALNLGRLNQKSREEYLGTQGTEVESGTNAQLPEQARIRLEEDQAKQVEIAKVSPYAEARAIDRLKLNLPKDSPARETLTQYDQEGQWYIPANQHGEVSTSARVVIKRGIWDEETGRGFGGERMDANSPNWRNDLHDLMELITGLTPKMMRDGITGKQVQGKYVQDQFGPTSPLTMHVEHAGRVIVTNGTGDSAQTFVFDYIDDGPDGPEFHLVNHFDSTKNFIEEVEDIGPLNNLPEKRGPGVKAESVRVSENPDKAERMSLADRVAASIDEMSPMERNAARLHKGPPKGGFWAKMSKAMDRFFNSENVMQRFRINVIDKFDRIVTREGQLMDQDGNIIEDEMSAVAAVRAYARVADMVSESLMNGYIKATAITNAQGEHEGAMIYEAVPFNFTNETVEMTIYNPATGQLEKKIFNAEVYKEEVSGMQGGMINARTALTPEENRLLNNYRSGLRSHNLRQRAILDGKKPVVPHTVEEELEWMQILNGPEGARIAVAVHNLNKLNEKTVEFLVATQVLSETEAAMWMENSDYIEFYRDFEGDSNYAEQMQRQREQAGVPGSLLGDITYEGPHKRFRGWSSDQGSSGTQEKVDPIEAAVSNYVGAITAGTINVARTRAVRNEVALDAARLVKDKKTALAMGIRATTKIRVNGQDQHYIIDDDLMFSALEGEWGQSIGETLRNDKYLKWMTQLPTQLLRETVTRDPSFIVPNLVRDATAAWLKYGSMEGDPKIFGPLPIITRAFGRSISNFRSDQKQRGELRRSGAKKRTQLGKSGEKLRDHGATTGVDDVSSHRGAKQIAGHAEKKIAGKKDNLLKQAWATAGRFSSFSESATREIVYEHTLVQEKKKLANSGKYSPADIDIIAENRAIHQAKEVLNFSTKGKNQYLSIYTSMVPFFNAFIQGADVMGRSMTGIRQTNLDADVNSAAHYKNVWRRAGYLFVAGAILEAMLMDDDDYESVSQYKRDNNYLIPDGFGGYWTIPAPHGVGWMLKQVPQQIARNIVQVSRGEGNKAARELANTITPTYDGWLGDGQRMPQVMKPFYEGFANQKLFGGGDINKRHQEGLDAADKHTSKTTAQAKLLGKVTGPVFGASPQNLDQVVGTMTGGLGAGLWGMFDAVLRFGGAGVIRPPGEIMKLPVLNRLHVDSGNQSLMSDYYKFSDMLFRAPTMLNAARSPQERQQIRKDNRSELIAAKQMKPIKQQMNKLRKKKEDIRLNSGGRMTRQAQKKQLDNIEVQERRILLRAAKVEEQMHARNAR